MRYLIAIIFALAGALAITVLASSPIASWVVYQYKFDSPDQQSNLFDAVFLGLGLIGMLIGWTVGWALGGALGGKKDQA